MRKYTEADFQNMVDFFDEMAQTPWLSQIHNELVTVLLREGIEMEQAEKPRLIDVGCGTGRLIQKLAPHTALAVGMDFSIEMVQRAQALMSNNRQFAHICFLQGDVEAIPFPNESFNIGLATCLIFLMPEPKVALREINRVLEIHGLMAMLNPSSRLNDATAEAFIVRNQLADQEAMFLRKWANVAQRKNRLTADDWEIIVLESGFSVVWHEPVLDDLGLLTFARK